MQQQQQRRRLDPSGQQQPYYFYQQQQQQQQSPLPVHHPHDNPNPPQFWHPGQLYHQPWYSYPAALPPPSPPMTTTVSSPHPPYDQFPYYYHPPTSRPGSLSLSPWYIPPPLPPTPPSLPIPPPPQLLQPQVQQQQASFVDDPSEAEKRVRQEWAEWDRICAVVKTELKMKTNIYCTENIAMNHDSGNDSEVKGYYKTESGGYKVRVGYLGNQKYIGCFQSESEAAVAYKIAMNEFLLSPLCRYCDIQNIIKTRTRNEIETMLASTPKPESNGYSKRTQGKFQTCIRFGGKNIHIGTFTDEWKAAVAYQLAYHKKNNNIPYSYSTTTSAQPQQQQQQASFVDDQNEEEKRVIQERAEWDRIRAVVKTKVKMKTHIDDMDRIIINHDSGNESKRVIVYYLGKSKYIGTYQGESEAAVAYEIAINEVFRSPLLAILLKAKKKAEDKQWESICTEIQNNINNSTRNEIEKMLASIPNTPESNGYSQNKNGTFQAQIRFGGKNRNIGTFADEWKAAVAYQLAYHKKNNSIPSSYSTTTAAASTSTVVTVAAAIAAQTLSSTKKVSLPPPQLPPLRAIEDTAAAAAAIPVLANYNRCCDQSTRAQAAHDSISGITKHDIGVDISAATTATTTSNKRQKLTNIDDSNNHHDDVPPPPMPAAENPYMSVVGRPTPEVAQQLRFPSKLYLVLDRCEHYHHDQQEDNNHNQEAILPPPISWLPDGKSFKVHDKERFVTEIMPSFFGTQSFKTFQRNLNLWDFTRISKGPHKDVCSHPLFLKGFPAVCQSMKRIVLKETGRGNQAPLGGVAAASTSASVSSKFYAARKRGSTTGASRSPAAVSSSCLSCDSGSTSKTSAMSSSSSRNKNRSRMAIMPCRARGMPMDHNEKTAYFVILTDKIKHGTDLICSHAACRNAGTKFRYCKHCNLPVAKRNFSCRHKNVNECYARAKNNHRNTTMMRNTAASSASAAASSGPGGGDRRKSSATTINLLGNSNNNATATGSNQSRRTEPAPTFTSTIDRAASFMAIASTTRRSAAVAASAVDNDESAASEEEDEDNDIINFDDEKEQQEHRGSATATNSYDKFTTDTITHNSDTNVNGKGMALLLTATTKHQAMPFSTHAATDADTDSFVNGKKGKDPTAASSTCSSTAPAPFTVQHMENNNKGRMISSSSPFDLESNNPTLLVAPTKAAAIVATSSVAAASPSLSTEEDSTAVDADATAKKPAALNTKNNNARKDAHEEEEEGDGTLDQSTTITLMDSSKGTPRRLLYQQQQQETQLLSTGMLDLALYNKYISHLFLLVVACIILALRSKCT